MEEKVMAKLSTCKVPVGDTFISKDLSYANLQGLLNYLKGLKRPFKSEEEFKEASRSGWKLSSQGEPNVPAAA
jgi:hypothetical protein